MYRMLIGGALVEGAGRLQVVNPASGSVFAECGRADVAQLNQAVAAAKAAFPGWAATPYQERRKILEALGDAVEQQKDRLTHLLTEEQGKPLTEAEGEVLIAASLIRSIAQMELAETTIIEETDTSLIIEQRTPLGVVVAILPWNAPVVMLAVKVSSALITGNTVVVKPAPTTPLTALLIGEIASRIVPAGVLSIIIDDNDLGQELTTHPDVAMISFTGSTATGKKIMRSAAATLKRVTLELGGNDAALVLDDADVPYVASRILELATANAGQVCVAAKRAYVPEHLYNHFCDEISRLAALIVVGDGAHHSTQMGPLQNRAQFERVKSFLEEANSNGTVIAGGQPIQRDGFFIEPTVVRDIPDQSRLVQEEQFGPIIPVLPYTSLEDAVRRINASDYGLGCTIWTADPGRGLAVAKLIESGMVWVNRHLDMRPDLALGGAKQSGIGRELGQEGLKELTQAKIINVAL